MIDVQGKTHITPTYYDPCEKAAAFYILCQDHNRGFER
jgi:hypothetical protein